VQLSYGSMELLSDNFGRMKKEVSVLKHDRNIGLQRINGDNMKVTWLLL